MQREADFPRLFLPGIPVLRRNLQLRAPKPMDRMDRTNRIGPRAEVRALPVPLAVPGGHGGGPLRGPGRQRQRAGTALRGARGAVTRGRARAKDETSTAGLTPYVSGCFRTVSVNQRFRLLVASPLRK